MSRTRAVKGMVSLGGVTYRIERVTTGTYGIVRISDDVRVGTFRTGKTLQTSPEGMDAALFTKLARAALHAGKTSWVYNPSPSPPPVREREEPIAEEAPASSVRRFAPA